METKDVMVIIPPSLLDGLDDYIGAVYVPLKDVLYSAICLWLEECVYGDQYLPVEYAIEYLITTQGISTGKLTFDLRGEMDRLLCEVIYRLHAVDYALNSISAYDVSSISVDFREDIYVRVTSYV